MKLKLVCTAVHLPTGVHEVHDALQMVLKFNILQPFAVKVEQNEGLASMHGGSPATTSIRRY